MIKENYGTVRIRTSNGEFTAATLLEFLTIPVQPRGAPQGELKVYVYGVVETYDGDFVARPLGDIKRVS